MNFVLGIVVGAFLTIGVAYVHDTALEGPDRAARTLVNWPAFDSQVRTLNADVSAGVSRVTESLPRKE